MVDILLLILQIIGALLVGILFGILTGLIPGIHINTIAIFVVALSIYLTQYLDPLLLACFIASMSITHTFLDSIPAIFLGAPDADMALNVLPGHKMLLEGKGYEAVKLTVIGSLLALVLTIAIIPFMIPFVPKIYLFLQPHMGF